MLVGEQPGDAEDLAGQPFVGPAGRLLDRCLVAAGFRAASDALTARRDGSCLPRLEGEIRAIRPLVVVPLGATAAQGMFGKAFRVTPERPIRAFLAYPSYALATGAPVGVAAGPRRRHAAARDRAFCRAPA
jgi:uracil-DNA glycosylase